MFRWHVKSGSPGCPVTGEWLNSGPDIEWKDSTCGTDHKSQIDIVTFMAGKLIIYQKIT
jgi:hypothetical protein